MNSQLRLSGATKSLSSLCYAWRKESVGELCLSWKSRKSPVATAQRRDQDRLRASKNTGEAARAEVESEFLQILRQCLPSLSDMYVEVLLIWNLI